MISVRRTAWIDVGVLVAVGIVGAMNIGKVPPAIPLLRIEYRIAPLSAAWFLSIFAVLGAFGGMSLGAVTDRLGHRRIVLIGLGALALAGGAAAYATSMVELFVLRALEGFGFIVVSVAIPPLLRAYSAEHDLRFVLGLWSTYVPFGSALALFTAPLAIEHGGWRTLWLWIGVVAALAALAVAIRIRAEVATLATPSFAQDVRTVVTAGSPLTLAVGLGFYTASYFALVGFLPTMLVAAGASIAAAASLTAIIVTANGCGNLAAAWLSRRVARTPIVAGGVIVLAIGGALAFIPSIPLAIRTLCAVIGAFGGGMVPAGILGAVPTFAPSPRLIATTQGLVVQGSNLGQLLGPVAVAFVGATRGGPGGSALLLLLGCAGAYCALRLGAQQRRRG